ncbi:MAG TPA: monovalent cation/H(+) antiporter subunit G, partial [Actinomycetaceae bacterium]|nr:monovalent cation/H(+) antiporter subunit G [Actinomycetaceae bacterium]
DQLAVSATLLLIVAFQILTGPISAHMLSRAGYRTGLLDGQDLAVDELVEDLERAAARGDDARRVVAQDHSTDSHPDPLEKD